MSETRARAAPTPAPRPGRVVVVFSGATAIPWLRMLKPGFRHCYALIEDRGQWLMYEPASHQTRIERIGRAPLGEVLRWLDASDTTFVCCRQLTAPLRMAPIRPFTCVEAVKRVLGIHAPWVLTPWQLFRHLTTENKKKYSKTEKILDFFQKMLYASFL